jgi:hypothetical protein
LAPPPTVDEALAKGVSLVGPVGLLADVTRRVLECGLEVEMSEHLGNEKHAPAGRDGGNAQPLRVDHPGSPKRGRLGINHRYGTLDRLGYHPTISRPS